MICPMNTGNTRGHQCLRERCAWWIAYGKDGRKVESCAVTMTAMCGVGTVLASGLDMCRKKELQ
jgi:hypothetical protein